MTKEIDNLNKIVKTIFMSNFFITFVNPKVGHFLQPYGISKKVTEKVRYSILKFGLWFRREIGICCTCV